MTRTVRLAPPWIWAVAAAGAAAAAFGADRSIADFNAAPSPAGPPAREAVPPAPDAPAVASAHGRIRPAPGGYRCEFDQAPLAEAAMDLARAWKVPVAYFGPPGLRTSSAFTAATASAALLQIADRTALRVRRSGAAWCLEEGAGGAEPPLLPAPWPAEPPTPR